MTGPDRARIQAYYVPQEPFQVARAEAAQPPQIPVIVSSSAESTEAPRVVHAPQPANDDAEQPDGAEQRNGAPGSAETGEKPPRGLLPNWAAGAAALKGPLAMQRSLSGLFGDRRVSQGSATSDESAVLEDATAATGWNAGERRRKLPQGASGVVLHKDLWKLDQMSETCDLPECSAVFSFTNRRHHCRMCGQIFCTPHASFALDLWYPPTEGDGLRSGITSRRQSVDVTLDQGVAEVEQASSGGGGGGGDSTAPTNFLLRLPSRRNLGKDVVVKPSRVCIDCYDRVWNPEKLAARERARRAAHAGESGAPADANDSDSQASHSGFSLVLDSKVAVNNLNERVLQRSRSARSTGRRMFSAPTSPASTSPTNQGNVAWERAIAGLATKGETDSGEPSRHGSRSSSLAPPGSRSRQNLRLARNASAHGVLFLPAATLSASTCESITPRPTFSPTAEALNVHSQQRRSSLSPNSSAGAGSYFPAMPPPSKPFLPGEEPNQHVNGVLSNYPLAYRPAPASGSAVTSPFTSRPPSSADLSGMARRMGPPPPPPPPQGTAPGTAARLPPAHMRIDLPHGGYVLDDPASSKASSARLLTPDREWVPGAWGYAKETFDPDVETDTEDEGDDGDEVDALAKRTRTRLIVDGDIRLKTRAGALVRETTSTTGQVTSPQANTRLMPWSTF